MNKVGLVRPVGLARAVPGHPAEVLELNPSAGLVLGVEIGHARSTAVMADLDGAQVQDLVVGPGSTDPSTAVQLANDVISQLLARAPANRVIGIGVGARGVVDPRVGVIEVAPDLGGYGVPVREIVEKECELPVGDGALVDRLAAQRTRVDMKDLTDLAAAAT